MVTSEFSFLEFWFKNWLISQNPSNTEIFGVERHGSHQRFNKENANLSSSGVGASCDFCGSSCRPLGASIMYFKEEVQENC
ncbi:hypothetical protein ACET3Z_002292 [Daucus carota]